MKANIMRAANQLIEALLFCDDEEFVNDVVCQISDAIPFDEDEIKSAEEEVE